MSASFDFEAPDHFTAGAVGPPGERVFYLQVREASALVTLKCEKEQVGALGEYLADLLARLGPAGEEPSRPVGLLEPIEAAWAVAAFGVGYDEKDDRILVVVQELAEEGSADQGATARFSITRAQARGFAECARDLVRAGRPICPMCGQPRDAGGHVCPRSNGHVTG